MAILTNINDLFTVNSSGEISFNRIGGSTTTGYTFPALDGTANYILKTNGDGVLSWVPDEGGDVTGSGTLNTVARWTATGSDLGDGPIVFSGAGTTADSTFGGIVTTDKIFVAKGQNVAHVASSIIISQESTTKSQIRFYGADTSTAGILEFTGSSSDGSVGGVRMIIDNLGNVGIGTASPGSYTYGSNLAIVDTGSVGITIQSNTTGTSAIQFADGAAGAAQYRGGIDYYHSGHANSSRMDFRTNGGTRMIIDNGGNIGMGISPTEKLDVFKDSGSTYIRVYDSSANSEVGLKLQGDAKTWTLQNWGSGGDMLRILDNSGNISQLWDDNGNVMIGNANNPARKLCLYEDSSAQTQIQFQNSTTGIGANDGFGVGLDASEKGFLYHYEGGDIYMETGSAIVYLQNSSGGVGIGTTSPSSKFTVSGSDASNWISRIENTSSSNPQGLVVSIGAQTSAYATFGVYSDSAYQFVVGGDGNVGIGTDSPQNILHLKSNDPKLILEDGNAGSDEKVYAIYPAGSQYVLQTMTDAYVSAQNAYVVDRTGTAVDTHKWYTANKERMRLNNTNETLKLTANTATGTNYIQFVNSAGTAQGYVGFGSSGSNNMYISQESSSVPIIFLNGGSERMRITSGGNVGINDTSAPNTLSVKDAASGNLVTRWTGGSTFSLYQNNTDGTVIFSANHGGTGSENRFIWQTTAGTANMKLDSGTLTVSADVVAYGSPSDKRLKENIKPVESALDKVCKLQGVTFDWKKSDSILNIKEDIGFIAQDVQKVIPELVRENENGMLSMRHQGMAPILLEAIKELKAEIEELKQKPCNCNNCNCK